jgi:hypothetical protein
MSNNPTNPYASTSMPPEGNHIPAGVDPALLAKINAIVKDAGQFWLAMILCLCCSALVIIFIGIWYAVRLMQWNSIANSQSWLMVPNAPPGSLPAKFQSAKTKLIIGMVFGFVVLFLVFAYVCLVVFLGATTQVQGNP